MRSGEYKLPTSMSALVRYAAAIYHLGPRQAARNLLHRATRGTRSLGRYAHAGSGLEWVGSARTSFLSHAGGARLAAGRFTAVGRTLEVGDPPNWETEAPLLWLFNLHYFAWLDALPPDEQRRRVLDWILRYPPSVGRPGWMAYPLSLRLRHWVALLFAAERWLEPERVQLIASIEAQAECLADTLEYHLRGNHLLESAITLKLLAGCFRGRAVARWERRGEALLDAELREQFLLDGGHVERSPMYHARLAHGLLDLVNVLPDNDETRVRIEQRLPGILRFLSAMRHPDGEIALFNDAAFGVAPEPGAILDYARRLGLDAPAFSSGSFSETGYHAWRGGDDALIVDAGPIGPDYLPAHGHGDIFSFELSLGGKRVVVDGGTWGYEAGPERDWVRSTRAHNTVEVGGQDQAEFFGAFRVGRRGRPHDVEVRVSPEGLQLSGWHDGYRRLPGSPIHRRELELVVPTALVVWDTVDTSLPAVSRVRFAPGARVRLEGADAASIDVAGQALSLRSFGAALVVEEGHYASHFGERLPCPVLALRKGSGPELGYVIARAGAATRIEPVVAEIDGRAIARRSRAAAAGRAAR
jgi:uncharacterized heparinase superfamily protein